MKKRKYLIKNIAQIKNGSTPSTKDTKNYDGDIIWITPKDLSEQQGRYIFQGKRNITEQGYNSCSTVMLPKGSILLSSRAPIGLLALSGVECCTNQGFKNIVVGKNVDNKFLYYYLKNRISEIEKLGSGTTFKEISKNSIENYEVEIPEDIKEQKKISTLLSLIDDKIELNNKINAILEKMANDLYNYWFVQFDFLDGNKRPYKSSGGRMVWNEILKKEIPVNWEVGVLSDIANITMGQSPDGNSYNEISNGIVFYQGSTDFGNTFPKIRVYTTSPTRFAKTGDILMSVRAPVGAINIANTNCCIGRGLAALNSKLGSIVHLRYMLEIFKNIFENKNSTGTTFGSITKDILFNLPVLIPSKDVIKNFNERTSFLFAYRMSLEKENNELNSIRDFILPMLMNGQISINS